jgi:hypothetical protein
MASRPDLPALLVAHKLGSAREIERAVRGRGDRPAWVVLLDEGVLGAQQLFAALREHAKFPVVSDKALQDLPAIGVLTRILSHERALALGILLLDLSPDGKRAQFAMVDPTDEGSLREVARVSALQAAKVFLIGRDALNAAIERAYDVVTGKAAQQRSTVEPAGKVGQRSELEEADRLERVLLQASLALGAALEAELTRSAGTPATRRARDAARIAREVARELGLDRRRVALVGLVAMLAQLDNMRRARHGEHERTLFDEVAADVGWAGGGDDGLLGVARAITAQSEGFGRQAPSGLLQRIAQAVGDFFALGGANGEPVAAEGLDAVEQLLRASSAGADVVHALMSILRRDASELTPALATALPEARRRPPAARARRDTVPQAPGGEADERTHLVALPQGSHSNDPSHEG